MTKNSLKAQIVFCAMSNSQVALHFREVPAIPGETRGGIDVDGGFFAGLSKQSQGL
jgi:hypothetical protein